MSTSSKNNTKAKEKRAVVYAHVLSADDRQDTTGQIEDLKGYAVLQGIGIIRISQEHISGAKKIEERQVFAECLKHCTKEDVNYLLLSKPSRLGRNTLQVFRSLETLHDARVSVYIQSSGLYTLQSNGKVDPIASIMVTVLAEMTSIERVNIQYRLNSDRADYTTKDGRLGRKVGSIKIEERKREEYRETIVLLKRGYSVRNIVELQGIGTPTVQRIRNQFIRM